MKGWFHDCAAFGWAVAAGCIAAVSSMALFAEDAEAITLTELDIYESTGQSLDYRFNDLPFTGEDGTLRIYTGVSRANPGVLDGLDVDGQFNANQEFFTLFVDGNNVGRYGCGSQLGVNPLSNSEIRSAGDCTFDTSFSFLSDFGLDLPVLIADGTLLVKAVFSSGVNHFPNSLFPLGDQDELFVSLSYTEAASAPAHLHPGGPPAQAVPTPALLPGLLGMGAAVLRRKQGHAGSD